MKKHLLFLSTLAAVITVGLSHLHAAAPGAARVIEIAGNDQMQYTVTAMTAKA